MNPYNEDNLVQRTAADYLAEELGWRSVYAWQKEDFGPESLLGRGSEREVVLTRILRVKLEELNPELPPEAYEDAMRQLTETPASAGMETLNRQKDAMHRDGVKVSYRDEKAERKEERLRVIDFEEPERNDFLCVREFVVQGELYRRRADLVGFVNGLPLLFIECKAIHRNLRVAFETNYADYRDTVPHLFHHNAFIVFANGEEAKVGSLTSKWTHFHDWKRLAEDEKGVVEMETLIRGICTKANFLDLLENFIVFDDSGGSAAKIIARNHQYLGVNRAVAAVKNRESLAGKLGVFWHTQGAGKSYSMVMFTRKVHRKLGGNFTFLVLTDREDLDNQLYKTFAGCAVVDHDKEPCRGGSGRILKSMLGQQKAYIFALVQKFHQEVDPRKPYTDRDDVIVVSDEAHRTQYGTLALNLRNALPNASFVGFTGTPLFRGDEITRQVFGGYLSKYDFQRAVEDHATVPLYYDSRGEKLGIALHDLNERIAKKIEELEIEDIDTAHRLENALKQDYHIMTEGKRLDKIARDFVQHYSTAWESGKAMLVCVDKVTCARMHKLIGFYWQARIEELKREVKVELDDQREVFLHRQISWMEETISAVVVSEEQGEVAKFEKWGIDIKPHRKLIKKGMALPEALRSKPEFQNTRHLDLDDAFKEKEHPFRIAIVCAMWLTGFDVPALSTLYLDKPLRAHTLMQAIARANRTAEGKTNGLIVDYCGILKNLRAALATFAGGGEEGEDAPEPARPESELLGELAEAIALVRNFLDEGGASLDAVMASTGFAKNAAIVACKEAANQSDETRKRFEVMARQVFNKFKACLNVPEVNAYRAERNAINVVYQSLGNDREKADISDLILELQRVIGEAVEVRQNIVAEPNIYDISRINFELLHKEFARTPAKRSAVQSLKEIVEQRLRKLMDENPLRTNFQQHYEEIVSDYNSEKDRVTIENTFEALMRFFGDLDEEEKRAGREGLDEETQAVYDLLKKEGLEKNDLKKIKKVAATLLAHLKAEKLKIESWRDKEATRDAVKNSIKDFLYDEETGLPESYFAGGAGVDTWADRVFTHIYRAYPELPSPIYGESTAA